ncbi:MAG: hypothetical protein ACI89U_002690, partial [Gammaproteobacteria bacterium]
RRQSSDLSNSMNKLEFFIIGSIWFDYMAGISIKCRAKRFIENIL